MKNTILVLACFGMLLNTSQSTNYRLLETSGNTSGEIEYEQYEAEGILLPGSHKTYDYNLLENGEIANDKALHVHILSKTIHKLPLNVNDDDCQWANYVEIVYQNDTLLVFGKNVLEITSEEKDLIISNHTVSLVTTTDFTTKSFDHYGLTGCYDFSFLIIRSSENEYFFIHHKNDDDSETTELLTLTHDEGMIENIDNVNIKNNTIILSINVEYQEGFGSYLLHIYVKDQWYSYETDRNRQYGYEDE